MRRLRAKKRKKDTEPTARDELKALGVSCLEEVVTDSKSSPKKVKFVSDNGSTTAAVPADANTATTAALSSIQTILRKARTSMASKGPSSTEGGLPLVA